MNSGVMTNQYIPQANMSAMGQNYQYPPVWTWEFFDSCVDGSEQFPANQEC